MRVNNWISFGCIMAAIAVGVAIAIMLSDIATMKAAWCNARPACFRDWIGALSGWAAAAGAAGAAYATVPYLKHQAEQARRQADEAKRQAAFLLGEMPPDMDVVEHLYEPGVLVVRVANWNRGAVFIHTIRLDEPDSQIELVKVEVNDEIVAVELTRGRFFIPPITLEGWIDRARQPNVAKIRITPVTADGYGYLGFDNGSAVLAEVQMVGSSQPTFEMRARILTFN